MRVALGVIGAGVLAANLALAGPVRVDVPATPALPITNVDANFGVAADDADFLFRLGMLEGHLLVGQELLQAHQAALALPHFGHPVRELYDDFADYLRQRKFPAFDAQLAALEAAVAAAPESPDTEAKYQAIIATVHRAREVAPAELRASLPQMIKVCADTIDAASGEYGEALERGRVAVLVEYHDSRGYLSYVAYQIAQMKATHPNPAAQHALDQLAAALAKAQWIVGDLIPAPTPRASVATYRSIASEASAIAKQTTPTQ